MAHCVLCLSLLYFSPRRPGMQENRTGTQIPRKGDRTVAGSDPTGAAFLTLVLERHLPFLFSWPCHRHRVLCFLLLFFSLARIGNLINLPPSFLQEGRWGGGVAIRAGDYGMRVVCTQRCQVACDAYKVHSKQDSARLSDRHVENILRTVTHN